MYFAHPNDKNEGSKNAKWFANEIKISGWQGFEINQSLWTVFSLFKINIFFSPRRYDDVFEESMARFYLAEMVVAVHALHTMGYVHR